MGNIPIGVSFRGGIKALFGWEIFWIWCWYMTSQFMWTGEYNDFNQGGWITKSVPVIVGCTGLSFASAISTGMYLFWKDNKMTRLGLVASSASMLGVAVVFVIGGVPIMWIDIVAMGYAVKKTWDHYLETTPDDKKDK